MGIRIKVYDKDRKFLGQIGNPLGLKITPRVFPRIGTAVMQLALAHKMSSVLLNTKGARIVFTDDDNEDHYLSGPVDQTTMDSVKQTVSVLVLDDAWILGGILGWQVPTSNITAQSSAEYRTYTGVAETLVKNVVRENGVTRLQIPGLVVAANLGRGATVTGGASFRMHPLPDRLYPGLDIAGIGLTVKQIGEDLVFDVYVPRVYPSTLSVESRTIKSVVHTRSRPTASRVVIGGPGEAKLRRYRRLVDTAREAEYGFCGETFRDARDALDDSEPENTSATAATMDARGQETLTEAGAMDGLSIKLAGSSVFTYGTSGVLIGDKVPVSVAGTRIVDTVTEAEIEWVTPSYVRAEPIIGEQMDPEVRRAKTLADLKASQRKEERS